MKMLSDVGRAFWVVALAFAVGLVVNTARSNRLDFIARESYDNLIFQPCPETESVASAQQIPEAGSKGGPVAGGFAQGTVLVDARTPEAFSQGHIEGAVNVPYDELSGVSKDVADGLKDKPAVVVYCDGWEDETDPALRYANPPSSLLADELRSLGVTNATFLEGGLKAYVESGGAIVTKAAP